MSIVVLAAGPKGYQFLIGLLAQGQRVDRVFSYVQEGDLTNAFAKIEAVTNERGIEFFAERRPLLRSEQIVLVVGWQYLLSEGGSTAIVFHDSLLPRYRGFAPTVSALICGEDRIGVTALRLADDADAGHVIAQRSSPVIYPMKIEKALALQVNLMVDLAREIVDPNTNIDLNGFPQNEAEVTLSIWRDDDDYWIDWNDTSDRLARTVDALGFPYKGASTLYDGKAIRILEVTPVDLPPFAIRQPGKIWQLHSGYPVVVCGSGALRIDRATSGGKEVSFKRLRSRFFSPAVRN